MFTAGLVVSLLIFLLIAIRQWLPEAVRIWQVMVGGAVVLLVLGEISPGDAFGAIDWNVIAYLFGVFSIAAGLYDSGVSHTMGAWITRSGNSDRAFLIFILIVAVCSAVLTNDAAAVIGTPIALMLARALKWPPLVPLIALCAAVTVGSMITPVGNPQNILIATKGAMENPVGTFAFWLAVPTILSLGFVYFWLRRMLRTGAADAAMQRGTLPQPHDEPRTWPAYLATSLLVFLIGADSVLNSLGSTFVIPFGVASIIACAPIYLFTNRRRRTFLEVDWPTLAFFVAMFVVTGSLLESGSLQAILGPLQGYLGEPNVTAAIAFFASQIFSNVPLVEIYLQLLHTMEIPNLMMLAGISTLAGNLFIISAASNVIVVQQAERLGQPAFTFWQFARIMLPVTVVSTVLTYGWVTMLAALL